MVTYAGHDLAEVVQVVLAQRVEQQAAGARSCSANAATMAQNEKLEQKTVLPRIVQAVNTDPEYAPLRHAFLARIVAQWIRQRHQSGHRTSFDALIDSGDLGPTKLTNGWRPRQVYDSFVRSIKEGDFTYTRKEGKLRYTMTVGGVDFSKVPMNSISAARMKQQHPRLPQTARASVNHPATASDGSVWLGETAGSQRVSLWTRTTGALGGLVDSRTGALIVILIALVAVTFGFRSGSRRNRRSAS